MMMKGLGLDESNMSNLTSTVSGETSISSNTRNESSSTATNTMLYPQQPSSSSQPPPAKKRRSLPGNPDPDSEVIALSPKSLLATNRFICEICNKGFQRDQNLQLHRRGHNLPWKLKQRDKDQVIRKKVYVCPEPSCVHHDASRALGDLTGIKKHYCRKHGEKKWKCDKCSKKYAVQSDWKAHSKICGTREYRCDCGTIFSRRDSFITHRAFCDALAEENARAINPLALPSLPQVGGTSSTLHHHLSHLSSHQHHEQVPLKREHHDHDHHHQHHHHLNFSNRPLEIPPWLACPPPQQQQHSPLDHHHAQQAGTGPPPEPQLQMDGNLFSFQHYDQQQNPQQHDPRPSLDHGGPTLSSFQAMPPPPQMSATALLQKAAEMGVTVSSQQHQQQHQHLLSSHGVVSNNNNNNNNNKPQPHTHMSTGLSSSRDQQQQVLLANTGFMQGQVVSSGGGGAQSSMLHDMMIMNSFQGFEDFHQGMEAGSKPPPPPPLDGGKTGGNNGGGGGGDGLTRDFLGLRTFTHKDFLNMAGLGHMSSSSTSFDQHHDHQNQTPW